MRLLIILLFSLAGFSATAQDWIVITSGDTIYCRILSVNESNIQYKTTSSEPPRAIAQELVESYRKAELEYYPAQILSDDNYVKLIKGKTNRDKGLRLGLGLGYTYRLAKAPDGSSAAIQKHIKKIKSGFNMKIDAVYFFGRYFGLGAKYTYTNSKAKSERISGYTVYGSPFYGTASDNINLHFIGLHPTARFGSSSGSARFLVGLTAGYLAAINRAKVGHSFTLKGNTFCMSVDMSLEFKLTSKLYLGLGAEMAIATIAKYNYDDGRRQGVVNFNRNNQDNLARFDFNAGIRYYL